MTRIVGQFAAILLAGVAVTAASAEPRPILIRNATRHSAEVLGKADELGTLEQGKVADLVLLDQNPLEDIATTKR